MERQINWGIIGCGEIAKSFAEALASLPDAKLVAVASTDLNRAKQFAEIYHVPKYYGNYEAIAQDPDVEVIYIANTHNFHKEAAILCLKHKKAVLCEKPITINAKETEAVIKTARENSVFLMEALWTRFHPSIQKVKSLLEEKAIGDIRLLKADFGIVTKFGPDGRHLNLKLAGGALLDVGIYPLTMAYIIFGREPLHIKTTAFIGKTGVDEVSSYMLTYNTGEISLLTSAVTLHIPHEATIIGTKGSIRMPDFFHAQKIFIQLGQEEPVMMEYPFHCNGYEYEAIEVMKCLRSGKKESSIMPLEESLKVMQTMDRIRSDWGLSYPGELK